MVRMCRIHLLAAVVVFLTGCPSEPKPWVPDGKTGTDVLGDGGVRSADVSVVPDAPFIDGTKPLPDGVAPGDAVNEVAEDIAPDLPPDVPCEPSCDGIACGPDGCGGSCGGCADGESCVFGNCIVPGEACDDGNSEPWDGCTEGVASEFRINTYTVDDQRQPAVAAIGDDFVVVWQSCDWNEYEDNGETQDGKGCGVFGAMVDSQLGVQGEFSVNQTKANNQFLPDVVSTPGGFAVSWIDFSGDEYVRVRAFDTTGTPRGDEIGVALQGYHEGSWRPAIACNSGGDILVVWNGQDQGGEFATWGQQFALNNGEIGVVGQPTKINALPFSESDAGEFREPRVLALDNGSFVVTWSAVTGESDGWDIFYRFWDSGEPSQVTESTVMQESGYDQRDPALAPAPEGDFALLFIDDYQHNIGSGGLSTGTGDGNGPSEIALSPVYKKGPAAHLPDIAMVPATGGHIFTWTVFDAGAVEADKIMVTSSAHLPPAEATPVNIYMDDYQRSPRVAVNTASQVLIVWESCPWDPWDSSDNLPGQGEDGCGVFGRIYSAANL